VASPTVAAVVTALDKLMDIGSRQTNIGKYYDINNTPVRSSPLLPNTRRGLTSISEWYV